MLNMGIAAKGADAAPPCLQHPEEPTHSMSASCCWCCCSKGLQLWLLLAQQLQHGACCQQLIKLGRNNEVIL